MDLELIHDLLTHAIDAAGILGVDEELRVKWADILKRLPPLQIGKHGQLQEWLASRKVPPCRRSCRLSGKCAADGGRAGCRWRNRLSVLKPKRAEVIRWNWQSETSLKNKKQPG